MSPPPPPGFPTTPSPLSLSCILLLLRTHSCVLAGRGRARAARPLPPPPKPPSLSPCPRRARHRCFLSLPLSPSACPRPHLLPALHRTPAHRPFFPPLSWQARPAGAHAPLCRRALRRRPPSARGRRLINCSLSLHVFGGGAAAVLILFAAASGSRTQPHEAGTTVKLCNRIVERGGGTGPAVGWRHPPSAGGQLSGLRQRRRLLPTRHLCSSLGISYFVCKSLRARAARARRPPRRAPPQCFVSVSVSVCAPPLPDPHPAPHKQHACALPPGPPPAAAAAAPAARSVVARSLLRPLDASSQQKPSKTFKNPPPPA